MTLPCGALAEGLGMRAVHFREISSGYTVRFAWCLRLSCHYVDVYRILPHSSCLLPVMVIFVKFLGRTQMTVCRTLASLNFCGVSIGGLVSHCQS